MNSNRIHALVSGLMIVFTLVVYSCSKKPDTPVSTAPSIVTLTASGITYTSAQVGGKINRTANDTIIEKGICFSLGGTPTIADSLVLSSSASDSFACYLRKLVPNSDYNTRAYFKTRAGVTYGNLNTFRTSGATSTGEPAIRIYIGGGYTNDVYALDAATGAILWNKKVNSQYCSSAIYSNGRVVVKGDNNFLTAFDTTGNIAWTRQLDGANNDLRLLPAIADHGVLYCRDMDYTYAINSTDGSVKWRSDNPKTWTRGDGALTLSDNTLYGQTEYRGLYAMDASTGTLKWSLDGYEGVMIINKNEIFLFNFGTPATVYSVDKNTGKVNWTSYQLSLPNGGLANAAYGRIYSVNGLVIDSASITPTSATVLPSLQFYYNPSNYPGSYPQGSVYPILADNLAISPAGVCDASSGELVAPITGYKGGYQGLSGGAYTHHVFYYTTGQYETFDPTNGGHWYSDVYAYDVVTRKVLWDRPLENLDLFDMEPCAVDRLGNSYRGAYTFK